MKRIGIAAFVLGALVAAGWVFTAARAQCTGVFPNNSFCGNLSGTPAPPGIVNMVGTFVAGPTTANANDLVIWSGSSAIVLADGTTTSIAGNYTFLGTYTFSSSITANSSAIFNSTFQIGTTVISWPGSGTSVAMTNGTGLTWSGANTFSATVNATGQFKLSNDIVQVPSGQVATVVLSTSPVTTQLFTNTGSATYITPTGVRWIRVRAIGGGGGGGAAGQTSALAGVSGLVTTFASPIIQAFGGAGGPALIATNSVATGGLGGLAAIGAGATSGIAVAGSQGGYGVAFATVGGFSGKGGDSCLGGGAPGGINGNTTAPTTTGLTAQPNTGSGGAGATSNVDITTSGGGGGAGGCVDAIINNPSLNNAIVVGSGGAGGTGSGTGAFGGGAGAAGQILVEEHYNW